MKKTPEDIIIYTSVTKIIIICYTVPEIWCVTDVYNYFSFWAIFCPFTHLTALKLKISKMKKKHLEISFYTSVPNWDMACDTCNFYFSFWAIFCPFTPSHPPPPLTSQKMKIYNKIKIMKIWKKKKEKNTWRYHHFTLMYQKSWLYAIYTVPEIWHLTDVIVIY